MLYAKGIQILFKVSSCAFIMWLRIFFVKKMSESSDFITGFIMVAEIIIMLWIVYSIMRDLQEMQKNREKTDKDKNEEC